MSLPSVSIVMTVTNRQSNLYNTLTAWSLLDYPDFDFTIVDNGTHAPDIQRIVGLFTEKLHIKLLLENAVTATNILWNREGKASRGEYVVFSMMDEIISHSDVLQKMIAVTDEHDCRSTLAVAFLDGNQTAALNTAEGWKTSPSILPTQWGAGPAPQSATMGHITGNYRKNWDWFGWYRDHDRGHLWLEQDIHIRELCLNKLAQSPEYAWCYHQAHAGDVKPDSVRPGYHYANEAQARLLEPAERDKN